MKEVMVLDRAPTRLNCMAFANQPVPSIHRTEDVPSAAEVRTNCI
jgi:hypothetical protein